MPGASVWINGTTPPAPSYNQPQPTVETVPVSTDPDTDAPKGEPQDSTIAPPPKKVK